MRPANPSSPSLDPRAFIKEHSEGAFAAILRERAAYVPQARPLMDFFESLTSDLPLLIEGGPGSGKTAFGEAIADAFNMPLFYLQCVPGLTISQVLYWFDEGVSEFTRDTLNLCDFLAAYDHCNTSDTVPLLLLDEIDKSDMDVENMLLQGLGRRYAHIPRLKPSSVVGLTDPNKPGPVIIITSNNQRELSEPLRSRCNYTYFRNPTALEEVAIMRAAVREATPSLLKEAIKMFHYIRSLAAVTSQPGLRESIRFIRAVARKGIKNLNKEVINRHLTYIVRNHTDLENLVLKLTLLETVVQRPHSEIETRVDAAFREKPIEVLV